MLERTLDELDPPAWGPPSFPSQLAKTCHALRRKPLGDFEAGDLRIMIGQGIGLQWLVPLALDVLEQDPLISGTFYDGDLLAAVCRIDVEFWQDHPNAVEQAKTLVSKALGEDVDDERAADVQRSSLSPADRSPVRHQPLVLVGVL